MTKLVIKATSKVLVKLSPRMLFWKQGEKPTTKTLRVMVEHDAPIHVTSVSPSGGALWTTEMIEDKPGKLYLIKVTPKDTNVATTSTIKIVTDFPKDKPKTYYGYARVLKRQTHNEKPKAE